LQKQAINELQLRIAETREDAKKAEEHQVEASIEAANIRTQREDLVQQFYAAGAYLRNLEASRGDRERRLSRSRDRLEMLRELQAESEKGKPLPASLILPCSLEPCWSAWPAAESPSTTLPGT